MIVCFDRWLIAKGEQSRASEPVKTCQASLYKSA